jgi:tripartite-type tricarboxylate transporter receptor subunit TctC
MSKRIVAAFVPLAVALAATAVTQAAADPIADFYKGREVRIIIGAGVGGSYGLIGQMIAKYIVPYVPGHPAIVVQAMPGAGGNVSLNYMENAAPQDGSMLFLPMQMVVHESLLNPRVKYKAKDFHWIGRVADVALVATAAKRTGIKTFEDTRKKQYVSGGAGPGNPTSVAPLALNMMAGTKYKVVTGYKGTGEAYQALEKGEVDIAATSWLTLNAIHGAQLKSGELIPIYVIGARRVPDIPNVPALPEFGETPAQKAFMKIYSLQGEIGRSMAAPPRMPRDKIRMWQAAFDKMIADPAFRADAEKHKVDLNPLKGPQVDALVADAMTTPADTVAQARKIYAELLPGLKKK